MTEEHHPSHAKLFLLVFHGGMVLYLLAHNLGIPIVRNLGMGNPWYWDLEFFWFLQVILFALFLNYDFEKPSKGTIPLLIYVTLYSTLLSIAQLIYLGSSSSKITLPFFSPTISLTSLSIFLVVFFLQFKKYFLWESSNVFRRHLLAIMMAIALVVVKNSLYVNPELKSKEISAKKNLPTFEESGCKGSHISFSLPLKTPLPKNSEILPCGFNFNLLHIKHGDKIEVKNSLGHPIHVRLDYFTDGSFVFKRIQVVQNEEIFEFPKENFDQDGIYRLITPSNPRLGIQILLKGDLNNLEKGNYFITPKTFEMRNNSDPI